MVSMGLIFWEPTFVVVSLALPYLYHQITTPVLIHARLPPPRQGTSQKVDEKSIDESGKPGLVLSCSRFLMGQL